MEYIKTGKCIWCGKCKSEGATFYCMPHILPDSLGGDELGVDICDKCNNYFGTATKEEKLSCDAAVKEVFQISRLFLLGRDVKKKPTSMIFHFSKDKSRLKLKPASLFTQKQVTRQFKRGICEAVFQKYHKETFKGNEERFDKIRQFALKNEGDITFYYVFNDIVVVPEDVNKPEIIMSEDAITKIDEFGLFTLFLYGHVLIIDMIPDIDNNIKKRYFLNASNTLFHPSITKKIEILNDITDLDTTFSRFQNNQMFKDEKGNFVVPASMKGLSNS